MSIIKLDENYLKNSAPFKRKNGTYGNTGQLCRTKTTYEDLFYLTDQIIINGEGRKADVSIETFVEALRKECRNILKRKRKIDQMIDLHKLAIEARIYIEKKVSSLLYKDTLDIKGLNLVIELAKSPNIKKLNIITLNHDTLIEQILQDNDIEFTDGFGEPNGDIRYFEDNYNDNIKVKIIKLHGSISWWSHGGSKVVQPMNITDKDSLSWKDKENNFIKNIGKVPSFLTGVNKIYSYNRGIYAEQNYNFLKLLHEENLIVMAGYGWGDLPINFQIQNWFNRNINNKLILLHEKPKNGEEIYENIKSIEFIEIYFAYLSNNQLVHLDKWLSDTFLSDIKTYLQ